MLYMNTTNQKGFTLIEALLIIIALTLISFAGWYVWNSQQDETKDTTTTPVTKKTTSSDTSAKPDETASWVSFSPDSKLYSIKLPDGWTLWHQNDDCDCLYALPDTLTYKAGTPATIKTTQGGRDLISGFSIFVNDEGQALTYEGYQSLGTFQTASGVTVKKYFFEQTEESDGLSSEKGTKEYVYVITKNNKVIDITYNHVPGKQDNLDLVNKAIDTFK